ncbi:single-stranded DNA-binding protein [Sutcliffiella horikoshii]|uniref:Single-stranded DNA-binding protein n=1 Tax=Sutcliffiella horikoshii TaxID=79883 RepID=A0A5D4T3F4_9BACI|nr:single-stranded DNA-binding protein [Sutcliffiella horikoshii]TYS69829.1 single-stranded DNA-binding protein [Sutcliffiella horikoshii]
MINEVVLIGRMVKDPDLRYTGDGTPVASFRLAVNRNFKNQEGVYEADFVSCTAWRGTAETTANYCRKGALVAVTGRIQTSRYESKDGTTVFVTDVVVDNVRFLEKKKEEKPSSPPIPPYPEKQDTTREHNRSDVQSWEQSPPSQENRQMENVQSRPPTHHSTQRTSEFPDFPTQPTTPEKVGV